MSSWTRSRVTLPESLGFDRCILDSARPGLRVVVFGGTHRDDTEGVLEIVPIVHEAACLNDTRVSAIESDPGRSQDYF